MQVVRPAADPFEVAESLKWEGTYVSDVKRLARWTGWCDPCETERPLILTETGERGLRAWLRGFGPEDRALTLTCAVCGEWQDVLHDEEDVPVEVAVSPVVALAPVGSRQVIVRAATFTLRAVESLPRTRVATEDSSDTTLTLVADGLDLIAMAG